MKFIKGYVYYLYIFLVYLPNILQSNLDSRQKNEIIYTYLLLIFLYPLRQLFDIRYVTIHGYNLHVRSIDDFMLLYSEVFYRLIYFNVNSISSPTIIDAGAEFGLTVCFYRFFNDQSTIYAFEPDPNNYTLLCENIEINEMSKVYPINSALSKNKGKLHFYFSMHGDGVTGSIVKNRSNGQMVTVQGERLSTYLTKSRSKKITIKMDIEGAEYDVLSEVFHSNKGKNIESILVEYHHNIPGSTHTFSQFIQMIEKENFEYKILSGTISFQNKLFQDILIQCSRIHIPHK